MCNSFADKCYCIFNDKEIHMVIIAAKKFISHKLFVLNINMKVFIERNQFSCRISTCKLK